MPCRLLFVAHREEILKQSMYTFRAVLRDANFGEMFVGSYRPDSLDNLFVSIQTFNSQDFTTKTSPKYYDYIIVDEFHHAAAPTNQKLLEHYRPKIRLRRQIRRVAFQHHPQRNTGDQRRFRLCPKGCYIQLEKKAAKYILDNIRASYGNTAGLVTRISSFEEDTGLKLSLANFLDYYHLDPRSIYKFASFSRLCARADVIDDFSEPLEETMTKAMARLAVIDSRRWISFLLDLLPRLDDVDFENLSVLEKRMLQMFYITVWGKTAEDWSSDEVWDNLYSLADSPILLDELIDLLKYQYDRIDFIDAAVDVGFDCPLDLHCTYTHDQLLVALDFLKLATVREGVKWLPDQKLDVFFVTLNKANKDYSPTTMYNDYSINEWLFHWQSQSTTTENSPTGQRYIHRKERGSRVLLFVREFKADRIANSAEAYTYLGMANYIKHEGEKPMNYIIVPISWIVGCCLYL